VPFRDKKVVFVRFVRRFTRIIAGTLLLELERAFDLAVFHSRAGRRPAALFWFWPRGLHHLCLRRAWCP
jgi:hypothetical protein